MQIGRGATVQEAFTDAREQAAYEHGHGGYTGSLAEKDSFTLIPPPFGPSPDLSPDEAAKEFRKALLLFADELIEKDDPRIDDKWGPAGALDLKDGSFLFFGWASS
jgi:hypothetical protein